MQAKENASFLAVIKYEWFSHRAGYAALLMYYRTSLSAVYCHLTSPPLSTASVHNSHNLSLSEPRHASE